MRPGVHSRNAQAAIKRPVKNSKHHFALYRLLLSCSDELVFLKLGPRVLAKFRSWEEVHAPERKRYTHIKVNDGQVRGEFLNLVSNDLQEVNFNSIVDVRVVRACPSLTLQEGVNCLSDCFPSNQ